MKSFHFLIASLLLTSACGTAYQMPKVDEGDKGRAAAAMAEEKRLANGPGGYTPPETAINNFVAVARRVEPVAENFCRTYATEKLDCDITISLTDEFNEPPNAFQNYDSSGRAMVRFNPQMLLKARNQDELAFILGHEMGHHMAGHIDKAKAQAAAGAIALGILAAYAGAHDTYSSQQVKQQNMQNMVNAGGALGNQAYSQTYELEADMIGARIAQLAGYDAEKGAKIFARVEKAENEDGSKSFWGTHPPSEKRLAVVSATVRQISGGQALEVKKH